MTGRSRRGGTACNTIISFEHRCIFIAVPKVASTALGHHFEELGLLNDGARIAAPLAEVLARRPEVRGFYTFGFVRNPWDRLLSCYSDKIADGGRDPSFALSTYRGLHADMSFANFVAWVHDSPEGRDGAADRHWMSQHTFFRVGGDIAADFIGRFERLESDLAVVTDRLGLPQLPLGRANATRAEPAEAHRYRDHYDARARDLVAARYAVDIALFDYAF